MQNLDHYAKSCSSTSWWLHSVVSFENNSPDIHTPVSKFYTWQFVILAICESWFLLKEWYDYNSGLCFSRPYPARNSFTILITPARQGAKCLCEERVCVSTCLSVCLSVREHISGTKSNLHQIFVHITIVVHVDFSSNNVAMHSESVGNMQSSKKSTNHSLPLLSCACFKSF